MSSELVIPNGTKIISIDVFDTLLFRNTMSERQRFFQIATEWSKSIDFARTTRDLFHSRLIAAHIAYRAAPKINSCREAKYRDIIELVLKLNDLDLNLYNQFRDLELDYEKGNLSLNSTLHRQLAARSNEIEVLAISDMYFSADEIKSLILHFSPDLEWLPVISSADLGINKASGELFKYLASEKQYPLENEWLHIGDNYLSDFKMPTSLGLNAIFYPRNKIWRFRSKSKDIYDRLRWNSI